jgi:membrane associated rhomboid family serine protease
LGASGAISGVLGGYLVLHPNRRVSVILLRIIMDVPGYVAVGIYFLMQLVLGLSDAGGGVAYSAHIGGFIAGFVLAKPFSDRDIRRQADQLVSFRRRQGR